MKILWLTWKDLKHPLAGGAEVVNQELAKRLAADGHEVTLLVSGVKGAPAEETIDGYKVVRVGNRVSVYWQAWRYYRRHLRGWADLVIDEVNTIPFFAKFYAKERNILFVHMLCREIWFYQMVFPLSVIGYVIEPVYLWLLRDRRVITVSESTKNDLLRFGFRPERISIISEGIDIEPVSDLGKVQKYEQPTLLSVGAIRPMKRTHHQIRAFELAKQTIPDLQLVVAGDASGSYGQRVLRQMARSPYAKDIEYLGRVSRDVKLDLMQRCHLIMVTSVKEGWGLVVTEAASQGIPAVVYDVDGLRDSVCTGKSGLVCRPRPADMAAAVVELIQSKIKYEDSCVYALRLSSQIIFPTSYRQFSSSVKSYITT